MGMSKFGPIKIAVVLFIAIGYLLIFGITERVESTENEDAAETVQTPADDTQTKPPLDTSATADSAPVSPSEITFPIYSDLNVANPLRPFEDNAAVLLPSGYEDILTEAETTAPPETVTAAPDVVVNDETTVTEVSVTEAPETEAEVTSAETTVSEEPQQTTDTEATEQTNPSGETLTIRYNGSGGNVEGDAADILARVVMGEIGGSFD